jgi:ketosteroid isomerase-like protein
VQWSRDWNARDLDAVCGLFAPDVVLLYPGSPDRDHATMCKGFAATLARDEPAIRYDPPAIEEILVDGDLAVVRLVWTARIREAGKNG